MKRVDLYSLTQAAIIIPCSSGVLYTQQCGGTECLRRQMEGVIAPINYEFLPENHLDSLEYRLMSLFPEGNPGAIEREMIERIQRMLDESPFTRGININHGRLVDSVESWLYVKITSDLDGMLHGFSEAEAVLTWPNSD